MLKKLFHNENRLNTYLVLGLFLFFTIWWIVTYFVFKSQSAQNNLAWSVNYQILAIVGAYFGFFVSRQDQNIPAGLKKIFKLFAAGLVCQALGQTVYAIYITVLRIDAPYASWADFFFLLSSPFYIAGMYALFKFLYTKERVRQLLATATFLWIIFVAAQCAAVIHAGYVFDISFSTLMNVAYIALDTVFASLALGALLVSLAFHNHRYRWGYVLIALGLMVQCFADFYFVYSSSANAWYVGSLGDYLYALAYGVMLLGIVQFTVSFVAVNLIVMLLNSFLFIQVLLSDTTDKFASNALVFVACFILSLLLLRRNSREEIIKEKNTRIQALEESHRRLEELDRQKTDFLNIAAHQLRTPVSIINSYVSMMQDGDYGPVPKNLTEVIANIGESNHWLVGLADEFLDIARLESHNTTYQKETGDLAALILDVAKEESTKIQKKGLHMDLSGVPKTLVVPFDKEKIKNVLLNFLDNAVKYTQKGKITIRVKNENGGVSVNISDEGIGFSASDRTRFFKKFQRGVAASKIEVDSSTGLGLYICRQFVEGHGGHVWAKSEGPGRGSEFGFWLPS